MAFQLPPIGSLDKALSVLVHHEAACTSFALRWAPTPTAWTPRKLDPLTSTAALQDALPQGIGTSPHVLGSARQQESCSQAGAIQYSCAPATWSSQPLAEASSQSRASRGAPDTAAPVTWSCQQMLEPYVPSSSSTASVAMDVRSNFAMPQPHLDAQLAIHEARLKQLMQQKQELLGSHAQLPSPSAILLPQHPQVAIVPPANAESDLWMPDLTAEAVTQADRPQQVSPRKDMALQPRVVDSESSAEQPASTVELDVEQTVSTAPLKQTTDGISVHEPLPPSSQPAKSPEIISVHMPPSNELRQELQNERLLLKNHQLADPRRPPPKLRTEMCESSLKAAAADLATPKSLSSRARTGQPVRRRKLPPLDGGGKMNEASPMQLLTRLAEALRSRLGAPQFSLRELVRNLPPQFHCDDRIMDAVEASARSNWPKVLEDLLGALCPEAHCSEKFLQKTQNALEIAVLSGHAECCEVLCQHCGARLQAHHKNSSGMTLLMRAAWRGHASVIKVLLRQGALVDARDDPGHRSALHFAALGGHLAAVCALLDAGADTRLQDSDGWTPLAEAQHKGHKLVCEELLTHSNMSSAL